MQGNGQRPESQGTKKGERASLSGLDAVWLRAEHQVPGWRTLTLRLPANGRGPMAFTIDTGAGGRPDQRAQLTLDRRSAEIIRWEPFSSYNAGRRLRSWFRFLHTGEAGGIGGQTIAAVASAGAAMLVWTGLWLAIRRWFRWRRGGRSTPERVGEGQVTTSRSAVQFFARYLVRLAILAANPEVSMGRNALWLWGRMSSCSRLLTRVVCADSQSARRLPTTFYGFWRRSSCEWWILSRAFWDRLLAFGAVKQHEKGETK